MNKKSNWISGGIVLLAFMVYFWTDHKLDEEEKGFKFKKVSKLNRDDLGIRKGKSQKYYATMLQYFTIEETKRIEENQPIPEWLKKRKTRIKNYLSEFQGMKTAKKSD